MMLANTRTRPASPARRGITLIEACISIVLVGVLLTASLQTVGMSRMGQRVTSERARGQQLALDLVNEILTQDYMERGPTRVFGLEPGKSSANRSQFTDVDDYNGWTESPPQDRSGNALAGGVGWRRSVSVAWADAATWSPTSQADTGLKLITVTTSNRGRDVSTVRAYRSIAWVDSIPSSSDATSNYAPIAAVIASKTTDPRPLITSLNGTSSTDRDGDPLSYVWNFGDGTSGVGATANHTYNVVGTYTATLTVYDGRGGVGSASVVLTVTP